VVPSHHHIDHSAGAAAFDDSDAVILTTPGNVDWFTRMARNDREFIGRPAVAAKPSVRVVNGMEVIGPVRILDVGPSGHADEHLVFYFPEHRMLFQSDMAFFLDDGSVRPASITTCALIQYIETNSLAVDTVVSAHGRRGTMDDLRRAVELRESPCL
jgi:glyoxylase-like metal-dependent hydrolase (beta-lactamase superfamily II)